MFKQKSEETLIEQAQEVSQELGVELLPPLEQEIPDYAHLQQLKEMYPERYALYLKLLRAHRLGNAEVLSLDEKVAYQIWTQAMNNLAHYLTKDSKYSGAELRLLQEKMMHKIYRYFEGGGREGYIVLPTQVGKTAIAAKLTAILDLQTLSVTERKFDVEQMKSEYHRFGVGHSIGIVGGGHKELDEQTTITTYASFRNLVHTNKISAQDYPLVILNEAHHTLGEKTRAAVEKLKSSLMLGLTATADFSVDKGVWWVLPNKIYEMPVDEAVREGLLKNVRVYVAEVETDLSDVKLRTQGDFDAGELERVINVTANNKAATRLYAKMFPGKRALVFCAGVEHAKALANEFNLSNIPAASVNGKTSESIYNNIMEKFDTGEIKVICNADLLIESFSQPKASVCLNLRPTLSMRLAEQRGGRVLALDSDNPEEEAVIVDFLYKSKKQLVTYYDVLGDARVSHATKPAKPSKNDEIAKEQKGLMIDGMKIYTETEEVVNYLKNYALKVSAINLRKVEPQVEVQKKEIKLSIKTWDSMLETSGRVPEEEYWQGRITNMEIASDINHIIIETKIRSLPVRHIIDNPDWVQISPEDLKELDPVESYKGSLKFITVKKKHLSRLKTEFPYASDGFKIRSLLKREDINPLPIKKAHAVLAWFLSSKHAKPYRSKPIAHEFLYIPTINNGVTGCITFVPLLYDKKEKYPSYEHDVIEVMYQKDISKEWAPADEVELTSFRIISNLT